MIMIMNENEFTDDMFEEDEFSEGVASTNDNGGTGDTPANVNPDDHKPADEPDLTTEVLRLKGIKDPHRIQFEDATGAVIERDWDSLTRVEQLHILSDQQAEENELSADEAAMIKTIRNSGMSVQDYMDSLRQPVEEPQAPSYKINELTDDEVFALDLLDKVGSDNITDEEIEEALTNAKKNEKLFKKTVEGLRAEYIRLQKDEEARIANEQAAQQLEAYNRFATSISREIQNFNSFVGQPLELSADDQEELAAFMLDLDDSGASAFGRALNNPTLFTKAAFWLLNEEKITEELTKLMLDTYKRGYEQAKRDLSGQRSRLVFNSKATKKNDPFVDDDEW